MMPIPSHYARWIRWFGWLAVLSGLMVATAAAEGLRVDFGPVGSPVAGGFQAYQALHEQPATFTVQSFAAFGTTVSIQPSWTRAATATAMQMIDRGPQDYADATEDLMRDWIGTDTRWPGDPLTLTIRGLPAGTYTWRSFHHDSDATRMGRFDVMVYDAAGVSTTSAVAITGRAVTAFDGVGTFRATIHSDGSDVRLVFDQRPYGSLYNEAWFILNGFELQPESRRNVAVVVDPTAADQTIEGLGGAVAFYNGWITAHPYKQEIYDAAFRGLNLSMLRLGNWWRGIDGQDTATYEIVAAAGESLGRPVPIMISSWSPPAGLKSNGEVGNGGTLVRVNGRYDYAGFADYWFDSLADYARHGIVPTWISIQNEPDWTAGYDSCRFNPTEAPRGGESYASYALALKTVAQRLARLPSPPRLLGPETVGIGYHVIQDFAAAMDTDDFYGLAYHLYHGSSDGTPAGYRSALERLESVFPRKPRFMTEYGDFNDLVDTAALIHTCLVHGRASGYNHWSLIWPGRIGLVEIEFPWDRSRWTHPKGYWLNPSYWAMKHYSCFIEPGDRRIEAASSDSLVLASAYRWTARPGAAIVLINTDTATSATVTLELLERPVSNSHVIQTAGSQHFVSLGPWAGGTVDLPPASVTTVCVSDDNEPPAPSPAAFQIPPTAIDENRITMTAVAGEDASGPVEYFFACVAGPGHDSGWQRSPTYTDEGLLPGTRYAYTVTLRDTAPTPNVGEPSWVEAVTTPGGSDRR